MSAVITAERAVRDASPLTGEAPPSPAGPVADDEPIRLPPSDSLHPLIQSVRFGARPIAFNLRNHRRFGDVWQINILARREGFVVTCHPDHVRSLLKAKPDEAPSLTGESPAAPDPRRQLDPHLGRRASHAPAQAAAAALPR